MLDFIRFLWWIASNIACLAFIVIGVLLAMSVVTNAFMLWG